MRSGTRANARHSRRRAIAHGPTAEHIGWRMGCVCVVFVLLIFAGCATPRTNMEANIVQVLEIQDEAWNRGDIDGFMAHYWKSDALTFSSGGKTTKGWLATLERYKTRYPTPERMGHLTFDGLSVHALGKSAAFVLGNWHLDRGEDSIGGNFTLIVRLINGRWLIVHDHTSVLEEDNDTTEG